MFTVGQAQRAKAILGAIHQQCGIEEEMHVIAIQESRYYSGQTLWDTVGYAVNFGDECIETAERFGQYVASLV